MKISNIYQLPQPLVDAVTSEYTPTPNRYSATTLLKGVKEIVLTRRHDDEIIQDVSEMVWLLFGTAVHKVLEESKENADQLKENRIEYTFDDLDMTVSGIFDLYDEGARMVIDYKTASTTKVLFNDWEDYRKQLLIYAYILNQIGLPCERGEIVAFLKDWNRPKAKREADYPKLPIHIESFRFNQSDFMQIDTFIRHKLACIKSTENMPDDEIPECTAEERWQKPTTWAVMKRGQKRAVRVLDSEREAYEYIADHGGESSMFVQERKGEDSKCVNYCNCKEFCHYWREHYGKQEENKK